MGRPKGYDREAVLEKAMQLFWQQGYEATSTRQLVEHLGINRNSMYSEFGPKRQLFEAALKQYEDTWVDRNFGPLEAPASGLGEISDLFDRFASLGGGRRSGLGCMLTNAIVELGPLDQRSHEISHRFITRGTAAFAKALTNARDSGGLTSGVDPTKQAQFLTSAWLGMRVLARASASQGTLDSAARGAKAHVRALASPNSRGPK